MIDAAMVDGMSSLLAMYWALSKRDRWSAERGTNMTDGGAPFPRRASAEWASNDC